ncbi:MAG: glycosyltransferase [Protaetiibacter sp.]
MSTAIDERIAILAERWGVAPGIEALAAVLEADPSEERAWTFLAAISAAIPSRRGFRMVMRQLGINGARRTAFELHHAASRLVGPQSTRGIELVVDAVLVDVHDTVATSRTSGIQRVVRETVRRWRDHDPVVLVRWTADGLALRRLAEPEAAAIDEPVQLDEVRDDGERVLIPVGGTFIATELVAEPWRARRLEGIAQNPAIEVGVIGYDCVPLTSPETASDGISRQFPLYLHALASVDRVVAISDSAADEFRGWRRMIQAAGVTGPEVAAVQLAAEISAVDERGKAAAAAALGVKPGRPLVLVVGSHEPRKNHLAVLQAARILWAEGLDFHLGFIGATSWNSERFEREVAVLQRHRRPVTVLTAASDALLAGAYLLAELSLFPSLHEGFGLPVAESLSLGTPVVTSGYGSMKQIVDEGGGGVLIDPRDDLAIAAGVRSVLSDRALAAALRSQAAARAPRTWDDYAADLWTTLIG